MTRMMKQNSTHGAFSAFVRKLSFVICFLSISAFAFAQSKVTGTVKDSAGEPIIGASVIVEGTTTGTTTAADGTFTLNVPKDAVLAVSYIGYEGVSQAVAPGQTKVDFTLVASSTELEDVVVIGYGTMKKSDLTGAVSQITSDQFKVGSGLNAQAMMQGAFAGVNVAQNSGKPGASNTIRVRGGTSINASNEPLYVIDGVPIDAAAGASKSSIKTYVHDNFDQEAVNPLDAINPNDIESINVLKDASATAIYGSRGANGVIIITTKQGKKGTQSFDYGYKIGISNVAKTLDVLNADEYRAAVKSLDRPLDDKGFNTDWQDEVFRTAVSQEHYAAFTYGGEKTSYRASLGYSDQQGVIDGSGIEKYNARMNINHSALNDKLKFRLNVNYGEIHSDQAATSSTVGSEFGSNVLYEAYVFNPTYPIKDESGDFVDSRPYRVNPRSYIEELEDQRKTKRFIGNLNVNWAFWGPLAFEANFGYTNNDLSRNSYIPKSNLLGEGDSGFVNMQKMEDWSKLMELMLKYNQSFGKHHLDAMAGYSYQYFWNEGQNTSAAGFLSDEFQWYNISAASTIHTPSSWAQSNKLISFFGRINWNYDDKYLVTATLRDDGSSRFGADSKWGLFPSVAASWRLSEEDFFKNNVLTYAKLRASWGITGSQEIGNYNSLSTLGASTNKYLIGGNVITIVLPQQYANPDLKWEETMQYNVGFDFGFLDGKIHGSIDVYHKRTDDLLLSVAVPAPSYITKQTANVGSVMNNGFEVQLGFDIMRKKDFSWTANFNLAHNHNKVLSLSNGSWSGENFWSAPCNGPGLSGQYSQMILPGEALGTFYGKKFVGVDANGKELFEVDENGNAVNQVIGCAQPDFTYGLTTQLQYKKWTLSMNFRGSQGNDVYNNTANNLMYLTNLPGRNVLKDALSSGVGPGEAKLFSSRFIEDGSYFRMDALTLGYDFAIPALRLKRAHVYFSAQNLFVITGYSGLDPEVNTDVTGNGVAPLGIDYLSYPKARTFTLGINLSF